MSGVLPKEGSLLWLMQIMLRDPRGLRTNGQRGILSKIVCGYADIRLVHPRTRRADTLIPDIPQILRSIDIRRSTFDMQIHPFTDYTDATAMHQHLPVLRCAAAWIPFHLCFSVRRAPIDLPFVS